jgi:thymidylate kinase
MNKFYLVEGIDGSGKTSIARLLAEKIGASYYFSPPDVLSPLREFIESSSAKVRYNYFRLGNYITSEELKGLLKKTAIVMDRYIYSTAAYHSVTLGKDLSLTKDLILPDYVIYVNASMAKIKERLEEREINTKYEDLSLLEQATTKFQGLLEESNTLHVDTTDRTPEESVQFVIDHLKGKGILHL